MVCGITDSCSVSLISWDWVPHPCSFGGSWSRLSRTCLESKHFHGWGLCSLFGPPVPVSDPSQEKCMSLCSDGILCGFPFAHCILSRAESGPLILSSSQQVLEHMGQISQSLLEQPSLLDSSSRARCSCPLTTFMTLIFTLVHRTLLIFTGKVFGLAWCLKEIKLLVIAVLGAAPNNLEN